MNLAIMLFNRLIDSEILKPPHLKLFLIGTKKIYVQTLSQLKDQFLQ